MKRILLSSSFLMLMVAAVLAFGVSLDRISLAIQAGNSRELAKYFDNNVEITIYSDEEVYSKAQAEVVLRNFFTKHQPSSFTIIHKGNSGQGSEYGIGTLVTSNGTFRTYIYIKQGASGSFIQEIRFEKD